jgi:hypothetical protein
MAKKLDDLRKGLKNVRATVQEELDSKNVNGAITGLRRSHQRFNDSFDEPDWGDLESDIY